ncbi:MAG: hypothetical protein ACK4IT_08985 [Thioalkalivibrionaceae bacterium]
MLKWFTVIAIAVFLWWRIQSWREARRRRLAGLPPETRRVRPITVLAFVFLAFYGSYMLWFLLTEATRSS